MLLNLVFACTVPNTVTEVLPETTYSCEEYPVLMDLDVIRIMEDFSYNEPVTFGEYSIGVASLAGGTDGGEWITDYQFDTVLSTVPELPFQVSICGPEDSIVAQDHMVSMTLSQNPSVSTIGDMITETVNKVTPPDSVTVEVTAMESCEDDNAGGFCL